MTRIKKKALVTGGSSGIGRAISESLIRSGRDVYIISRKPPESWVIGPINGWSSDFLIKADLSNIYELKSAISSIKESDLHLIDIIVLAAVSYGLGRRHDLSCTSLEEWDEIFKRLDD